MARLESDRGRLLIAFQYRGVRCREYLGLRESRENRRAALRVAHELELEIAAGKFDYAVRFPTSRYLTRLGLEPVERSESPTAARLAEFASRWLDERRAQLSAATAYDYLTILRTHILPSALSEKPIDAIDDGDIMRLIGELRQKHTRYGGFVQ